MRRSLHIGIFIGTLLGAAACGLVPEPVAPLAHTAAR
jgi:hypothetical protein